MKKKRWWSGGSWVGAEIDKNANSNSIKKHTERIASTYGKKYNSDGNLLSDLDDDDYGYSYSSYHWDLDKKLLDSGSGKKNKKELYKDTQSEYGSAWKNYQKTGYWAGYQRQPQLTYKYVQQMANALSAQHDVKIQIGNSWNVDILSKTLTYNPASLIYGTKSELLATLMHEIGKLRYVTHSSLLNNKYLAMYGNPPKEVLSLYEDVRTDFLMLQAYESAGEIYESVIPTIEKQVKSYREMATEFKKSFEFMLQSKLNTIKSNYRSSISGAVDTENKEFQLDLFNFYGTGDLEKVEEGIMKVIKENQVKGNLYDFCSEILSVMYDIDATGQTLYENIVNKVEQVIPTIDVSKKFTSSQELINYLDEAVFPIVEDLFKEMKEKSDALEKAFPDMPQKVAKLLAQSASRNAQEKGDGGNLDGNGETKMRHSQESNSDIPPEWESGEYKPLRDSVSMEIRQLISRLTFLRREELTIRFEANQKRGKLNSRTLYKSAFGSKRLFKQKLENTDTIRSFAFSILLDVSGSMSGRRIVHCTRALIILTEVFKKMQIPFEIVTYSDGATTIKPFGVELDKKMEKKIGGLPQHLEGGTNLHRGLNHLNLKNQPESNKICIVLTDGGVGRAEKFDQDFFVPWSKKGVKSVGFGVECEDEMAKLCMGNSKVLENASQLPNEFSKLLKDLIKR